MRHPPDKEKPALAARAFQKSDRAGEARIEESNKPSASTRQADFARAMARAEFGKNYWSDELELELRRSLWRGGMR